MEGPLIHHMSCSNWTSRNASVLGKKETELSYRLWHLAERRDGFFYFFFDQTKKKHREKEKVGMGPEMCQRLWLGTYFLGK